jgi:uncharacterized protein
VREIVAMGSWLSNDSVIRDDVTVAFENEGFTAEGKLHGPDVSYVVRFDAVWNVRQFLLFRDIDDPDLWLAVDKFGRWGEVNGVIRADMAGCNALGLSSLLTPDASAFLRTPQLRRMAAAGVMSDRLRRATIDVDTLGIVVAPDSDIELLPNGNWLDVDIELALDETGLVRDVPGSFARLS